MPHNPIRTALLGLGLLAALAIPALGQPPAAAFFSQPTFAVAGAPVTFLDTSSFNPTAWLWNFDDPASGAANTSTLQNPTHVFATAAIYNVELTATNAFGSNSFQAEISVGPGVPSCVPNATTLCLVGNRFAVTTGYVTPNLQAGVGHAVPLTDSSGYFWFFDASNVEIVAKVLDGCSLNGAYWVFSAGLTNAGVILTVVDTTNLIQYQAVNTIGVPYVPVQDTQALDTSCP